MLIYKKKLTRENADGFSDVPWASQVSLSSYSLISLLLFTDNQNLHQTQLVSFIGGIML